MGADLYIRIVNEPLKQKYEPCFDQAVRRRDALRAGSPQWRRAQREVGKYYYLMYSKGYFRDSYNATCVLATLGLSWWEDVTPLCEDRELKGEHLAKFREMVAKAEQRLPTKDELKAYYARVADQGGNSLAAWHEWFIGQRKRLLAFLDQAIELNTTIHCSL